MNIIETLAKEFELKVGQVVREDGPKSHLKKAGTPTMGGIVILIASLIVLSISAIKYPKLIMAIVPFIGFGIVGFIDDFIKLVLKNPMIILNFPKLLKNFLPTLTYHLK